VTDQQNPEHDKGNPPITSRPIGVFLTWMAVAMLVGLTILYVRSSWNRSPKRATPAPEAVMPADGGQAVWHRFFPMGGIPLDIKLWGRGLGPFMDDVEASEELVEAIEREISNWRPESVTSRINNAPAGAAIQLSDLMIELLRASRELSELSHGAFNPAVGPLIELWKEAERRGSEPTADEIERIKDACSLAAFDFDAQKKVVTKLKAGARLDFGAIGKGYIVDKLAAMLEARGAASGIVAAAGDLRVFGGTVSRQVRIQHPEKKGILYGYFHLQAGAVSTAGNGDRFFRIGEKTYGSIMDGRTLRPADGPLSVTLVGPSATMVDALATAAFVLGADEGRRFVESIPGLEACILVKEDNRIRALRTKGFPEVIDMSEFNEPYRED
jgi:FAD:protein FMN transferase